MTFTALVFLLVGLVIGAVAAWFVLQSRTQSGRDTARAHLAEARASIERAEAQASAARAEASQARELQAVEQARASDITADRERLKADLSSVQAEAERRIAEAVTRASNAEAELRGVTAERDAALAQTKAIEADRQRLVDQFKVLSSETLEHQNRVADAAAAERQKQVDAIVAPLAQNLKDFQERLNQMEKEKAALQAELSAQVRQVVQSSAEVRRETTALATALRRPQVRGQWGELQLKRVAEKAGMLEHCHFAVQGTTTTADTTIRPDMTVMLGDDKYVHVDSKVPLASYLDAQEASDEAERDRLLKQFSKNVRTHVDQLSGKQYWKSEAGTPEFVVMFIPLESLAAEAFNRNPDLLDYAADKGIVIATPSTLIALLKTVAFSWRQAALADNARQVFEQARELYERLAVMGGKVDKLGRALTSAVKAYNDSVGSLERRVLPQARRLRDLNVSDRDLPLLSPLDEVQVRQLTAPELVESAEATPTIIGRDELAELESRQTPSADELVEGAMLEPAQAKNHLRRLS